MTLGGPPVPAAQQAASKRRSLYFYHSNNDRNLFLTTFDQAAVKECYRREQSIVPQQALALTNSSLVQEAAPRIASHLQGQNGPKLEGTAADAAFIQSAYAYVLGTIPSHAETAACLRALAAWRAAMTPGEMNSGSSPQAHLVWSLLNHNDFVTLR